METLGLTKEEAHAIVTLVVQAFTRTAIANTREIEIAPALRGSESRRN